MNTLRIIGGPSEHSTPPRSNPFQPQTPILKPPKAKPAQPMQRRMLKLKDAAHYVAMSVWTLRRILREGEIPFVQRGEGNITLDQRDLDLYIEKNKRTG